MYVDNQIFYRKPGFTIHCFSQKYKVYSNAELLECSWQYTLCYWPKFGTFLMLPIFIQYKGKILLQYLDCCQSCEQKFGFRFSETPCTFDWIREFRPWFSVQTLFSLMRLITPESLLYYFTNTMDISNA